ncbi:MAG: hypothetical protein KGL39_36930 [Patescibacteria group bacterium]|nr:hypothetical protein [Patescibacteria group bacterium]
MGAMKNYLLTLLQHCSEEKFGQDAIEWAVFNGHVTLTYNLEADTKTVMGEGGANYDKIIEAYRRAEAEHGAALLDIYHASGLMEEILRPVPIGDFRLPIADLKPQPELVEA